MDLIDIFKRLEKKEDFEYGIAQSDEQINGLEQKLGVKFPIAYRKFLESYGYVSFFGGAIYGPSDNPYYDLLRKNKLARQEQLPSDYQHLPKDAFVIESYPGGGYFMLFSDDSPRKGQVSLFIDETSYGEAQNWDSFEEFLFKGYCSGG